MVLILVVVVIPLNRFIIATDLVVGVMVLGLVLNVICQIT